MNLLKVMHTRCFIPFFCFSTVSAIYFSTVSAIYNIVSIIFSQNLMEISPSTSTNNKLRIIINISIPQMVLVKSESFPPFFYFFSLFAVLLKCIISYCTTSNKVFKLHYFC